MNIASPEPIYRQIEHQVKVGVALGGVSPGKALPSVRELAQRLVVNPNTVARAYRELEQEGVVETRRGVGTFVADRGARLAAGEKRRILGESADRLITETVHLGLSLEELIGLVKERASRFDLPAKASEEAR